MTESTRKYRVLRNCPKQLEEIRFLGYSLVQLAECFGKKVRFTLKEQNQELLMRKWIYFAFLLACFLTACSSGEKSPSLTALPKLTETFSLKLPTKTASLTQAPEPTLTSASTQAPIPVSSESMPGCTAKSLFPTPNPTMEALFPPVSQEDWARGPETASVTLIEYSDFQ